MKNENKNTTVNEKKEQTVSVYLPSDGIGPYLEGAINGVAFRIPTGKVVEVPKRIAAVIRESRSALESGARSVSAYRGVGGRKIG
jgi:hypothetical protein